MSSKIAVVTGGGSGIGAAIALMLVKEGFKVAIGGRNESKLKTVADQSESITPIQLDVVDRSSVSSFFDQVKEKVGKIDVLVNCAGTNFAQRSIAELDPENWDALMQINATGAYNCMREVLDDMRTQKDGVVVNISSVAGKRAVALGGIGYNASKFAMSALGISVGDAEKENNIRVTNVYPGEVETPILDARPVPVSAEHRARILQPEDVAASVQMIINLPPRARIPELVIIPTSQSFV